MVVCELLFASSYIEHEPPAPPTPTAVVTVANPTLTSLPVTAVAVANAVVPVTPPLVAPPAPVLPTLPVTTEGAQPAAAASASKIACVLFISSDDRSSRHGGTEPAKREAQASINDRGSRSRRGGSCDGRLHRRW